MFACANVPAVFARLHCNLYKHTLYSNSHNMDTGPGDVVPSGAVFVPLAHDVVLANIIISHAANKTEQTHNRLQLTKGLLQPYLSDLNIMHQRHDYIDAPLVIRAREGLVTANNMLDIARLRLNGLYAMVAPGFAWTRDGVFNKSLTIHEMLHRAEAVNLDNLHLFHLIDGPNTLFTRAEFGNTFNGSHANTRR